MKLQVNLVGQDAELIRIMTLFLSQEGYKVKWLRFLEDVGTAEAAQLWIVDLDRPTVLGYERVKGIKKSHFGTPIIIISASGSSAERLLSLEIGADDYIEKPFEPREMVLRVQRVLTGRSDGSNTGRFESLKIQGYVIDDRRRTVSYQGREIQLTSKEFDLMMMFARYTGYALSREQILDAIWGTTSYCNYRVVDDLVRRLRFKLESLRIETIYGHGYRACV